MNTQVTTLPVLRCWCLTFVRFQPQSALSPVLQIQYTEQIYIDVVFQSQWCIKLQMHVAIVHSDKQEDTGHVQRTRTYLPSEPRQTQSCCV